MGTRKAFREGDTLEREYKVMQNLAHQVNAQGSSGKRNEKNSVVCVIGTVESNSEGFWEENNRCELK